MLKSVMRTPQQVMILHPLMIPLRAITLLLEPLLGLNCPSWLRGILHPAQATARRHL